MQRLTYKKIGDSVIEIDLLNGFIVRADWLYDKENSKYKVNLYLRKPDIYIIALMGKFHEMEFDGNYKTLYVNILKEVSSLLSKKEFDFYFTYYNFMLKCFEEDNFKPERKGGR